MANDAQFCAVMKAQLEVVASTPVRPEETLLRFVQDPSSGKNFVHPKTRFVVPSLHGMPVIFFSVSVLSQVVNSHIKTVEQANQMESIMTCYCTMAAVQCIWQEWQEMEASVKAMHSKRESLPILQHCFQGSGTESTEAAASRHTIA